MTEVLKMSRKALTVGIVLSTVLWSMMASVLVAPLKASAAGCTSGSLIKGSLAAVYYCGSDGKRYVFTNDRSYKTWYADFSSVTTISDADLASIQIGGNVTYRPGVKMVKIVSDPKTYAVAHGGVLRHIPSEACAVSLYGSAWNTMIDDVSDAFFTNYSIGAQINAACTDYNKTAELSSSQSINADKNLSTGGGVSGSASVSLAADSPAGATLPGGAMGVNFLKFNLTNTGSAMTVDSITLRRVGAGNTSDISAVYLYDGSTRLTTGRSVNSSTNEVNFTGLNLSLGSGQTRSLWVAVDLSTNNSAGNVHAFEVMKALSGSTQLSGSSIRGNNFTISGAEVGDLTIDAVGTITDPKVGEMEAKIAEFRIDAGTQEDIRLKRVTLFQGGNLSASNLTNLKLKQAGLTIATASGFDNSLRATFVMSEPGMLLEKGASKTFQLYGDIGGTARAGDEIEIYVEEAADVYGVGQTYGYGVQVDRDLYDGSTNNVSLSEIEAGQLTLNLLGPSSKDIAVDGNDVEVLRFSAVAQSNIEVRRLRLDVTSNDLVDGDLNYTDLKINNVSTGANVWGPEDVTDVGSNNTEEVVFDSAVTLQAGVLYTFAVTVDVEDGADDADTLTVSLANFLANDLRNLDNSTFLDVNTDVVPANGLTGNTMTVRTSSLTTSLGSTPVSQTYIKGSTGIDFLGLNLKAGDAAPVTVTSITATGYIDEDGGTTMTPGVDNAVQVRDITQTCRLKDGTTQVGQAKSPTSSTAKLEFTGLNLVIAAGQTKSLRLNCDISNSAYVNNDAERIGFSIQSAADVVAQDVDGNSVNPIGTANATAATVRHLIQNTGSMSYTLAPDDTESEAGLVIAGNGTVVLGKIRLTAANEELKQTKIRISLVNNVGSSVNSMSLYDGSTLIAGPVPLSGQNADFSGFNFVVPKDGSKTLTVKAALNTISNGATSGADLQIMTDLTNPTTGTFEYRGTSSSTVATTINTADLTGRVKVLRKTKPTVSLAALPTSTLSNGTMILGRVTVTADAAEQVSLKTIAWTIAKSDQDIVITNPTAQSSMREVGQGAHINGSAYLNADCSATGTACRITSTFASEQVIAAGTSKTYELVVLVSGAVDNDSVSTNIAADSGVITNSLDDTGPGTVTGDSLTGSGTDYNFIWSDNSAIPHTDALAGSTDWTNGLYVKVLPTDSQTVLF